MLELLLIRHGESAWNATGRYQGHADISLSETGVTQARALGKRLSVHPIDAMYCPDLRHARKTAAIIARQAVIPMVREDCRWRELHLGSLSGLTLDEARALGVYRRLEFDTDRHPGGESKSELRQRVSAALDHVTSSHSNGRIVVVAHGGSIQAAVGIILGTTGCNP